jgi:hypothetical protein
VGPAVRDRDQPSSLDETPIEDRFPVRFVALFCDRCGDEIEADIRADAAEQAYEGLRRLAVGEYGWLVADTEDVCRDCQDPLAGWELVEVRPFNPRAPGGGT